MSKQVFFAVLLAVTVAGCVSQRSVRGPTRLDATSAQSAEASFGKMADELPGNEREKLFLAMLAINLKGVNSAHEVVNNPALQSPSIAAIKDEVNGMSAREIIDYAAKVSTVRMKVDRK